MWCDGLHILEFNGRCGQVSGGRSHAHSAYCRCVQHVYSIILTVPIYTWHVLHVIVAGDQDNVPEEIKQQAEWVVSSLST